LYSVNKKWAEASKTRAMHRFFVALSLLFLMVSVQPSYAQQDYAQDGVELSQAELDQLLAPIALYPDALLTHILIASTYPLEIVQANRWVQANSHLSTERILKNAEQHNWDPSVQALTAFPDLLQRMSENLDWTQALGDAFLYDEEYVLASIQNLRHQAHEYGSLEDLENLRVVNDDHYIVLEPAEREIIYVPYYDVDVVYGPWRWRHYPPVRFGVYYRGFSFHWGPRVYVGPRVSFSAFSWRSRHIVRINRATTYHKKYKRHNQILNHYSAKRWVHSPKHRRGVHYSHARVNRHYTPHRNYRPSSRYAYSPRKYKESVHVRKVENKKHYSSRDFNDVARRLNEVKRERDLRQNQFRNNQTRNNQTRNNQSRNNNQRSTGFVKQNDRALSAKNQKRPNSQNNVVDRRSTNQLRDNKRSKNDNARLSNNKKSNNKKTNQKKVSTHSQNKSKTVKVSKNNHKSVQQKNKKTSTSNYKKTSSQNKSSNPKNRNSKSTKSQSKNNSYRYNR